METHLKALFARFEDQFASGPGLGPTTTTCLLRVDGLPTAFLKSLFRAAAALFRTDPWKRLHPSHLFALRIGKDTDWRNPFTCAQFIGAHGGDLGVHLFRSHHDPLKLDPSSSSSSSNHPTSNMEILRVVFAPETLLLPSTKRMIRSLQLESSGPDRFPVIDVARFSSTLGAHPRFRNPTLEELRYVYAFLKAIALVHPLLEFADNGVPPRRGRIVSFEPLIETVDVQWPPEVSNGGGLVAVTISHPTGQTHDGKKPKPMQKKYGELAEEEQPLAVEAVGDWAVVRRCTMCDKEVVGDQLCLCGQCLAAVYCSPVCQKQHWKEAHKSMCGLYKAMMEREEEMAMKVFAFSCFVDHPCKWLESMGLHHKGMWRRRCSCYSNSPFGLLPGEASESWGRLRDGEFPPDAAFPNWVPNPILLSGWSEYYNLRSLPMSSPVAALLSHPLTVYHILTTLVMSCKNRLIKGKEVVVHYLGPEGELDWMPAFAEISHMLNGLGSIHIVMIGPEVPSTLSGKFMEVSGRVRMNVVRGIYQEEAAYLSSPHVVVALNCGLESYASWGGTLELIKTMNVPVFFTDQTEILCANAKQVLRGAGLQITHPVTPNPFRSPLKDQAPSSNLPSFSNGFVFGANR